MKVNEIVDFQSLFLRSYICEVTMAQFRREVATRTTQKRPIYHLKASLQWRTKFDPNKGYMHVRVPSARESRGNWPDPPKYKPAHADKHGKLTHWDRQTGKGKWVKVRKFYDVEIQWDSSDWETFLKKYYARERDVGTLFYVLINHYDVKVHCNCPTFHWGGIRKRLTDEGAALYPYRGPDKGINIRKIHSHGGGSYFAQSGTYPLCKHIKAVMDSLVSTRGNPAHEYLWGKWLRSIAGQVGYLPGAGARPPAARFVSQHPAAQKNFAKYLKDNPHVVDSLPYTPPRGM